MNFVFVPGAWIGGWAFRDVARELRGRGHEVFACTLTGLGDRRHLSRPGIDLETHITDVMNVIETESLREVSLVGHSYGSIVVSGVADRMPERMSRVIYLDAAPWKNGQRFIDFSSPDVAKQMRETVEIRGEGWQLPYPGFEKLGPAPMLEGLGSAQKALLDRLSVAQPFATYTQPLVLSNEGRGAFGKVVIACNGFRAIESQNPELASFITKEWTRHDLQHTSHWPMLSNPIGLADVLEHR